MQKAKGSIANRISFSPHLWPYQTSSRSKSGHEEQSDSLIKICFIESVWALNGLEIAVCLEFEAFMKKSNNLTGTSKIIGSRHTHSYTMICLTHSLQFCPISLIT